jgi:hypothetical protein
MDLIAVDGAVTGAARLTARLDEAVSVDSKVRITDLLVSQSVEGDLLPALLIEKSGRLELRVRIPVAILRRRHRTLTGARQMNLIAVECAVTGGQS